ncbi:MAG: AbrB/MazE/SpoVT family DNA-binding domain-containing protein [Eubacterium sp.]|jgi:AbrB family transcriptional regulator (stage V sporulation protein T)|nr:AbrB/MazE/SpoVT family DNA-binding domain-containing protein [Eubacterium sp.]
MKATGVVRKIDDLGRIVIPKEIRKTLKVKEGMPLEIFTDQAGDIVLRKYLPFSEYTSIAAEYAESLLLQTGAATVITDREKVIASAGCRKRIPVGVQISESLEKILDDRNEQLPLSAKNRTIPVIEGMEAVEQVFSIIRSGGEILGAVFLLARDPAGRKPGETEKKLTAVAAEFLGRQAAV